MDLQQLKERVAALGFESDVISDKVFIFALNRALQRIDSSFPLYGELQFAHVPLVNALEDADFELRVKSNTNLCFRATGQVKAYTFECDGNGIATLYGVGGDGTEQIITSVAMASSGTFTRYSGTFYSNAAAYKLIFSGSNSYVVRNVAMYRTIRSNNAQDVPPYGEYACYDLRQMVGDKMGYPAFGGLCACTAVGLNEGTDYLISGEKLYVSSAVTACFDLRYRLLPPTVDGSFEGDLPVDERVAELLPLYVAGYAWLEDYPEKADYYLKQFEAEAKERGAYHGKENSVRIKRTGWS